MADTDATQLVKEQVIGALNRLVEEQPNSAWGEAIASLAKQYVALERLQMDS